MLGNDYGIRDVALLALWTMQRQSDLLTMPTLAHDDGTVMVRRQKTGARSRPRGTRHRGHAEKGKGGRPPAGSGQLVLSELDLERLSRLMAQGDDAPRIKGVTFHDLRGTAITYAYAHLDRSHNETIRLISEISGHSREDAESIIRKHYLAGQEVIDAIGRGTNRK